MKKRKYKSKYSYMGYTLIGDTGWYKLLNNMLSELDRLRPWYLPRQLLNFLYYLSYGYSVVYIRNKFWNKIWNKYVCKRINYLHINDIKEKFGELRVYYEGNELVDSVVETYECYSKYICYKCSMEDPNCSIESINGWLTNLCNNCKIKYNVRNKE